MSVAPEIDFEQFLAVDMRVGRVVTAGVLGAVDDSGRVALLGPDPGARPGERIG